MIKLLCKDKDGFAKNSGRSFKWLTDNIGQYEKDWRWDEQVNGYTVSIYTNTEAVLMFYLASPITWTQIDG